MKPRYRLALLALLGSLAITASARAHRLKPAVLELRQISDSRVTVRFTKPIVNQSPVPLEVELPPECREASPPHIHRSSTQYTTRWTVDCPGGLVGKPVAVRGLDLTGGDVFVRATLPWGETSQVLTARSETWSLPEADEGVAAVAYIPIGVEHILLGPDHLLFVLALCLLIGMRSRKLVGAITAFTIGHSITLGLATLGVVSFRVAPVEALIALSVVFLAREISTQTLEGGESLTRRRPWLVSGTFGLLHGFGFAGALSEVGMPRDDIPLALLSFNVGVELGQLCFVGFVFGLLWILTRMKRSIPIGRPHVAYAIGGVAAFWFVERTISTFS